MTREARRQLIKARVGAVCGARLCFPERKAPKPAPMDPKRPRRSFLGVQLVYPDTKWLTMPDAAPVAKVRPKRRKGDSALTRIARQLPKKLKR